MSTTTKVFGLVWAISAIALISTIFKLGLAGVSRYTALVLGFIAFLTASPSAVSTKLTSIPNLDNPWLKKAKVHP